MQQDLQFFLEILILFYQINYLDSATAFFAASRKGNSLKYRNQNSKPPADHTLSKDGFMHKSGLEQPLVNCVSCHGSDLTGGTTGVSCFECHGTKW